MIENTIVVQLQKLCQRINDQLGSDKSYLLGRVKTVVDGAIQDPEQRRAVKDLIDTAFWQNSWPGDKGIVHREIELFGQTQGIKTLFPDSENAVPAGIENPYAKS